MLRKNLGNILAGLVVVGAGLVAYNAFLYNNDNPDNSASSRIADFLSIDQARESSADSDAGVEVTTPTDQPAEEQQNQQPEAAENTTDNNQAAESDQSGAADEAEQNESEPSSLPDTGSGKAESVYTVKEGDTYGCIAEKYYGSYEHYVDIMAANPIYDLGFGEYSLFVDAKLVLPAIDAANQKPATSLCQ